jgi:hypothetical protein
MLGTMRHLIVLFILLGIAGGAVAQGAGRIVLLRGRYKAGGPALFNYAGEMTDAAHGVAAADAVGLSDSERVRLERVVQRYHTGGTLYVLLDEEGSTVAMRGGASFTMVYPGGGSETVSAGFVDIGNAAPERPFVAPWWSWASLYRRNVRVTVAKHEPSPAPASTPAAVSRPIRIAMPSVSPAPLASTTRAVTSPVRRSVYPLDYTYVAPPRPRASAPVRSALVSPAMHGTLVGWGSARVQSFAPVAPSPLVAAAPASYVSAFAVPWHASYAHPSFGGGLAHAYSHTGRSFRRR